MKLQNDIASIKHNLYRLEKIRKDENEQLRIFEKEKARSALISYFRDYPSCKVWLFGSLVQSYHFTQQSDIDIAVSGYPGSRLDLFPELERIINWRSIDLIIMESSRIAEEIREYGERII